MTNIIKKNNPIGDIADTPVVLSTKPSRRHQLIHANTSPDLHKSTPHMTIDAFDMQYIIGKGGGGIVWKGTHKGTGISNAIKIIEKADIICEKSFTRALSEHTIMSNLNNPFITKLHYSFQGETQIYLVMELIEGGNLLSLMRLFPKNRMPELDARFYLCEIILAVEYIHHNGIGFRDIKPENILVTMRGHLKITDFGLATKIIDSNSIRNNTLCGTPEYMAPEMVRGSGHGMAVDIWAIGCMMYEFIYGYLPFKGDTHELFVETLRNEPIFMDPISDEARSIITLMLDKDPLTRIGLTDIKTHIFFEGVCWDDVVQHRVKPPKIPVLSTNTISHYATNASLLSRMKDSFVPYSDTSISCKSDIIGTIPNADKNILNNASIKAGLIVKKATHEAFIVISDARAEATSIIADAQAEAVVVVSDAQAEAVVVVSDAQAEAVVVVSDAQAEAVVVVSDARAEADVVVSDAQAEAVVVVSDAQAEAVVVVSDAQTQTD